MSNAIQTELDRFRELVGRMRAAQQNRKPTTQEWRERVALENQVDEVLKGGRIVMTIEPYEEEP